MNNEYSEKAPDQKSQKLQEQGINHGTFPASDVCGCSGKTGTEGAESILCKNVQPV